MNAAQDVLVSAASDTLQAAENASNELHVFGLAKGALEVREQAVQGLLSTAQAAVDKLADCAEFAAFDIAEGAVKFAKETQASSTWRDTRSISRREPLTLALIW